MLAGRKASFLVFSKPGLSNSEEKVGFPLES